jgi:DNA-binding NarL/FixJ family response regulator
LGQRDFTGMRCRVMRIVVASEEDSTRAAIGMLIAAQPDLELVGEVGDIADLLLVIKTKQPDLVVLDWDDLRSRIETLQQLLELFDEPPMIVALSVHEEARAAVFDSGVAGFAFKGAPPSELLKTIRASHR